MSEGAWIVGTAGHIDHGKTSLVRALTGCDTDRLAEEKARGISIELGFAPFDLPSGRRVGIVDVPGHRRFLRNMLAGAHGFDAVLFAVAADDGVMPQTEEHFEVVQLLGVERAVFAITKTDLVDAERIAAVGEEIEILTLGTALESSPVIPVSALRAEGLAEVSAAVDRHLQDAARARGAERFRMPVDRAFSIQGHGLVVTGTAIAGLVKVGDALRIVPGSAQARVRAIQVHDNAVDSAQRGQRVALNLGGVDDPKSLRGRALVDPAIAVESDCLDVRVEVRPLAGAAVANHSKLRVHLGTAQVFARLVFLDDREVLEPKESAWAQLRCDESVHALRGDRFILRSETAERTLGGGRIVQPFASRHRRGDSATVVAALEVIDAKGDDPRAVLGALLGLAPGFLATPTWLAAALDCSEADVLAAALSDDIEALPSRDAPEGLTTAARWRSWCQALLRAVAEHHEARPLEPGADLEELRQSLPGAVSQKLFRSAVERLVAEGLLRREARHVALPDHQVELAGAARERADRLLAELRKGGLTPPTIAEIAAAMEASPESLREILHVLAREGRCVEVGAGLWILEEQADRLRQVVADFVRERGPIAASDLRDALGASRKFAIPLLEFLDRSGFTIRVGDRRTLRRDA